MRRLHETAKMRVVPLLTFILGFAVAAVILRPDLWSTGEIRDTRDIWQLREALEKEQKEAQQLYQELAQTEKLLIKYQKNQGKQSLEAMEARLQHFKREAGLTKVSGQGIVLTVEPLISNDFSRKHGGGLHASLMLRLINELNFYGAQEIAIDGERLIATSPIRMVNGKIFVNDEPISDPPFTIKVLARNAKKLHNEMQVANSREDFARSGYQLHSTYRSHLTLPPYDGHLLVRYMELAAGKE